MIDAQTALEKLANESYKIEADLQAGMVAVEKSLDAEKARVERLERELATVVEKKQQLLAKRQEKSQIASCPLGEG